MAIRMEVLENGKIELFNSQQQSWSEHESVCHAMAAAAIILRREIDLRLKEQPSLISKRTGNES